MAVQAWTLPWVHSHVQSNVTVGTLPWVHSHVQSNVTVGWLVFNDTVNTDSLYHAHKVNTIIELHVMHQLYWNTKTSKHSMARSVWR